MRGDGSSHVYGGEGSPTHVIDGLAFLYFLVDRGGEGFAREVRIGRMPLAPAACGMKTRTCFKNRV